MEQRAVIKFHVKLGKNESETFWLMQQIYGNDCLSRANVFLWRKRFLESKERLEDDNREGRLMASGTPPKRRLEIPVCDHGSPGR